MSKSTGTKHRGMPASKRSKERQAYLMIAPQLIGFFVFSIYPILWVFRYSFFEYDGITEAFVGFDNFLRVFRDVAFWKSIVNTFIIAYGKLIIELPLALVAALLISSKAVKAKKLFAVGYYLPCVTGTAVNCLIFSFLFATVNGIVNDLLMKMGMISAPINWFGAKWSAMFVIITESLWAGFAANVLYFTAGVQNISEDVLEAAEIDGANKIQTFFHVTLPMLAPVIRIVLMLAMINGVKIMNEVLLLTNGGPANETNVVMLHIYKMFFDTSGIRQYGYASALGVVTSIILGLMTFVYLAISKKTEELN